MHPVIPPPDRPPDRGQANAEPTAPAGRAQPSRRRSSYRTRPALLLALLGLATVGFNETRVGDWTVSDVVFVATAGVVMAQLLAGHTHGLASGQMRRSSVLLLVGAVVMLSAGTLSSLLSFEPFTSMSVILRYAWLTLVWFWILRSVTPDRPALQLVLRAIRAGVLVNCVVALLGYFGVITDLTNTSGRQSGFFMHSNALAGYLVMALPLFLLGVPTAWTTHTRSVLRTHVLPSGIVLFALATTGSITAAVAAIAGCIALALLLLVAKGRARRRRHDPLRDIAILAGIVIAVMAMSQSGTQLVERYTEYTEGSSDINSSASFREEGARFVLDRFDERLILGVGFDSETAGTELDTTDRSYGASGSGIHNMLLKMYYEGGAITVLGFVVILFSALQYAWRIIRNTEGDVMQSLPIALIASLVSLNVLAFFQPMGFERFYWLPVGLIGVVWAVRREEVRPRS